MAIILGMGMLAYASVPLYRMFCAITGAGGTTQQAVAAPKEVSERTITVRFNADVDPGIAWEFHAPKPVTLRIGEETRVFFEARNIGKTESTGTATYNVTPFETGSYFNKVQCFCFDRQTLKPGEKTKFSVDFFVDPAILTDKAAGRVDTITLSYTFFPLKN